MPVMGRSSHTSSAHEAYGAGYISVAAEPWDRTVTRCEGLDTLLLRPLSREQRAGQSFTRILLGKECSANHGSEDPDAHISRVVV